MPEYEELMPHRKITDIKRELEHLKKKASSEGASASSKDFKESADRLNDNINRLLSLFKEAAESMKVEEEEPGLRAQIDPLMKRINEIEDENKKIAQGILVIADMIRELKVEERKIEGMLPKPKPMQMPRPVFRQMPAMPPPMPAPLERPFTPPMQPRAEPFMGMQQRPMPPPMLMARPMPPGLMPGPSPMPPFPEFRAGPKKEGFLSKLFKK
jgi:hypothetical protein